MKVPNVKAKSNKIQEYESNKEVFVLDDRNGFNFLWFTAKNASMGQILTNNCSSSNNSPVKTSQGTYDSNKSIDVNDQYSLYNAAKPRKRS